MDRIFPHVCVSTLHLRLTFLLFARTVSLGGAIAFRALSSTEACDRDQDCVDFLSTGRPIPHCAPYINYLVP